MPRAHQSGPGVLMLGELGATCQLHQVPMIARPDANRASKVDEGIRRLGLESGTAGL
jgi:hypothetical protein